MKKNFYERTSLINGLLALAIISLIAFGCVCDDLDGEGLKNGETDTANEVVAEDVVPSDAKANAMAETKLLEFADAFESGDYSTIHSTFAEPLQKHMTAEKLESSFSEFLKKIEDAKLNIRSIKSLKPEFMVKPFINDRELQRPTLFLIGHYATEPLELEFKFKYIFQDDDWILIGFNILENDFAKDRKSDKDGLEVPSSDDLQKLIEADLAKVKDAIDRKKFSSLHKHVSTKLQQQSTPAVFEKIFAFFPDWTSDGIGNVPGKSPQYIIEPHINRRNYDDPTLVVNGFYEITPRDVNFKFRYISEDGKWKLSALTVDTGTPMGISE